jgi:dienelactone hydrolase
MIAGRNRKPPTAALAWLVVGSLAVQARADGPKPKKDDPMPTAPWSLRALSRTPRTRPADGLYGSGAMAVYYDGLPFGGKPTRVFAWVALPAGEPGRKVPGIVLVHGGAGTAFARWAVQWARRGYAAIAMDTCGCVPKPGKVEPGVRHAWAGPPGWGGFDQLDRPIEDQWTYHAVADVILAHSLLRSFARVDGRRVGLMGISWGGFLASIAAGVDRRFAFAVIVYGCGFLEDGSPLYLDRRRALGPKAYARWARQWDPSRCLPGCRIPALWIAGTNDLGFSMASRRRSCRATPGDDTLSLRVRWPHNYQTPWRSAEIAAFADGLTGRGRPLARIVRQGRRGREVWASYASERPAASAQLCYTLDAGPWRSRRWQVKPARLDPKSRRISAMLPKGTTVYYLNLIDDRGLVVSAEHVEPAGE